MGQQRKLLAAHARALAATTRRREIAEARRRQGTASEVELLEARRAEFMSAIAHGDVEAEFSRDYLLLQKSLGLGWQQADGTETDRAALQASGERTSTRESGLSLP